MYFYVNQSVSCIVDVRKKHVPMLAKMRSELILDYVDTKEEMTHRHIADV